MREVLAVSGWVVALFCVLTLLWAFRRKRRALAKGKDAERLAFIGSLAAGLAHEMKNPLSTLGLNLQLLREEVQRPTTVREEETYRKVATMIRETSRLEGTINDFLRFAAGHSLELVKQDVNTFVRGLADSLHTLPSASSGEVKIVPLLGQGLPLVAFDQTLLRQALRNLLTNAVQAMPGGGVLTIQTRAGHGKVEIDVTDDGEGMSPETLQKLFNVYFSTKKGGTGLGLPTAKRIVEEHGGDIAVRSSPGSGATFTVSLPSAESRQYFSPQRH
ncbi:MAG: ATP-binding protein [Planctomycetota bacterium]|nr:ATP-binding protein [Planctomycetota bacterium]